MNVDMPGNEGKSLNNLNPYLLAMIRARIIVKGNIQEVGYRAKVKEIADRMSIKGKVDNLPDGNVEIIAEGEREVLDKFIKDIRIKNELITVQEVIPKFEEATGEFKAFTKVIRNEKTEIHERADSAIEYLKELITTVKTTSEGIGNKIESGNKMLADKLGEKIDCVGNKVESGNEAIRNEVKAMHDDMNLRFDGMAKKQDDTIGAIHDMHDDMNKRFDWMAETYGEFGRTLKSLDTKIDTMNTSITEMKNSFAKLVDHIVNKTERS